MKIVLNCLFFLLSTIAFSQNSVQVSISNSNWNNKTILAELFGKTYVESIGSAKWKPYAGEAVQCSFDGFCYTTIDSIYNFKNESLNYKIVVLKTISYADNDFMGPSMAEGSTVGIALFSEEKNNWKLVNFNRSLILNGAAGILGNIELIDLGNSSLLLALSDTEHQETDTHTHLFSLDTTNFGMKVFSTRTFHRIMDENDAIYIYEFSEFSIKKASSENEEPVMELLKKRTTIKEEIESTEVLSKSLLKFNGVGFYE